MNGDFLKRKWISELYIYNYKKIRGGNIKYILGFFFILVKILEMRMNLRMIKDENNKR